MDIRCTHLHFSYLPVTTKYHYSIYSWSKPVRVLLWEKVMMKIWATTQHSIIWNDICFWMQDLLTCKYESQPGLTCPRGTVLNLAYQIYIYIYIYLMRVREVTWHWGQLGGSMFGLSCLCMAPYGLKCIANIFLAISTKLMTSGLLCQLPWPSFIKISLLFGLCVYLNSSCYVSVSLCGSIRPFVWHS